METSPIRSKSTVVEHSVSSVTRVNSLFKPGPCRIVWSHTPLQRNAHASAKSRSASNCGRRRGLRSTAQSNTSSSTSSSVAPNIQINAWGPC